MKSTFQSNIGNFNTKKFLESKLSTQANSYKTNLNVEESKSEYLEIEDPLKDIKMLKSYARRKNQAKKHEPLIEEHIDTYFSDKIMDSPFAGEGQFEKLKNEVVYHSRKQREDDLNFERIKQKMKVDNIDIKGAFFKKYNNQYIDPDLKYLKVTHGFIKSVSQGAQIKKKLCDFNKIRKEFVQKMYKDKKVKGVRFDNSKEIINEKEEFRRLARQRWFQFVKSHPDIFHIPNFLSVRKKRMKRLEENALKKQHSLSLKRNVHFEKRRHSIELKDQQKTILYKKVRGWIQSAMDALETDISHSENILKCGLSSKKKIDKNNKDNQNMLLKLGDLPRSAIGLNSNTKVGGLIARRKKEEENKVVQKDLQSESVSIEETQNKNDFALN